MDYTALLRTAWGITWRYKYLWVLGLFAAEGGGCSFSSGSPNFGGNTGSSGFGSPSGVEDFFSQYWALLLALLLGFIVLAIALWVISIIATGGLIAGTDTAYHERTDSGLGDAWRAGLRSFWRLLGMWLLIALMVFLAILLVALAIGLPIGLAVYRDADLGAGAIVGVVLFVILLVLIAIPSAIALQIVSTWANRSLVLEGTGVVASLRAGWRLFRANIGVSLMVWLIAVGVSIGMAVAVLIPLAILAIPIGLMIWRIVVDANPALWVGLSIAGLVLLVVLSVFKAATTTYFGAYYTVAYRQLTEGAVSTPVAGGGSSDTVTAPWVTQTPAYPASTPPSTPQSTPSAPDLGSAPPSYQPPDIVAPSAPPTPDLGSVTPPSYRPPDPTPPPEV